MSTRLFLIGVLIVP